MRQPFVSAEHLTDSDRAAIAAVSTRRPCCRPSSAHDWRPLVNDPNHLTCTRCGRLAGFQRGGRLGSRGRLKIFNYPEIEAMIRERAAK